MVSETLDADWQEFLDNPASYATSDRLSESLDGDISSSGCRLLLSSGRLQGRLSRRLSSHFGLSDTALTLAAEDRSVALLSGEALEGLAVQCGAVLWANSIAGMIGKEDAAVLHGHLGDDTVASALGHRDLSAPPRPIGSLETIADRVRLDGWSCFYAWLAEMPQAVDARLRLKLPEDEWGTATLDPDHIQLGPSIVRRVIGEIG